MYTIIIYLIPCTKYIEIFVSLFNLNNVFFTRIFLSFILHIAFL